MRASRAAVLIQTELNMQLKKEYAAARAIEQALRAAHSARERQRAKTHHLDRFSGQNELLLLDRSPGLQPQR